MEFTAILDFAAPIAALTAVVAAVYIARNKAVLESYRVTVDSQNVRLTAQEGEIAGLVLPQKDAPDSGQR